MCEVISTNQEIKEILRNDMYNVWESVRNLVERLYEMDILFKSSKWNNWKYELKYRRGGKSLCTLYVKDDCINLQIVFGKHERAKFEDEQESYSLEVQNIYNNSTTYHDGKWMAFELKDLTLIEDIQKLLYIKRKPNKK